MKTNFGKYCITKLVLLLSLSSLLCIAGAYQIQISLQFNQKGKQGVTTQYKIHQDGLAADSEYDFSASALGSIPSVKENSSRLSAALHSYNCLIRSRFTQYAYQFQNIRLNYRKADLLYPSYYFW